MSANASPNDAWSYESYKSEFPRSLDNFQRQQIGNSPRYFPSAATRRKWLVNAVFHRVPAGSPSPPLYRSPRGSRGVQIQQPESRLSETPVRIVRAERKTRSAPSVRPPSARARARLDLANRCSGGLGCREFRAGDVCGDGCRSIGRCDRAYGLISRSCALTHRCADERC
jgi:hypothetical protein